MNTENLTNVSSILPNRGNTPVKRSGVADTEQKPATPVAGERQDVADSGNKVPVNRLTESREAVEQDDQLDSAVSEINSYVQNVNRKIQFSVDDVLPLGRSVVKVIDSDTDKVIREIPSKEVLQLARRINEQLEENAPIEGLVFTDRA